jgi:fructose-1,6-bisphosphatase
MVRGSYDLHAKIRKRKVVSDWKTSKVRKEKKDIFNYLVQVAIYALIGNRTYDNEVDALDIVMIYPNREPDVITLEKEEMNYYCNIFVRHLYNYYSKFLGSKVKIGDKYATSSAPPIRTHEYPTLGSMVRGE